MYVSINHFHEEILQKSKTCGSTHFTLLFKHELDKLAVDLSVTNSATSELTS